MNEAFMSEEEHKVVSFALSNYPEEFGQIIKDKMVRDKEIIKEIAAQNLPIKEFIRQVSRKTSKKTARFELFECFVDYLEYIEKTYSRTKQKDIIREKIKKALELKNKIMLEVLKVDCDDDSNNYKLRHDNFNYLRAIHSRFWFLFWERAYMPYRRAPMYYLGGKPNKSSRNERYYNSPNWE